MQETKNGEAMTPPLRLLAMLFTYIDLLKTTKDHYFHEHIFKHYHNCILLII